MKNFFSWGSCDQGQLGISTETQTYFVPQKIEKKSSCEIVKLSCGFNHTLILFENGKVYSFGNNDFRKLGYNEQYDTMHEIPMLESHKIIEISAGHEHTAAINDLGKLFMWGRNDFFELGRDSINDNSIRLVSPLSYLYIVQVSCGANHTIALSRSSSVYTWGANDCGQLGLSSKSKPNCNPTKIESIVPMPIKYIRAGDKFSLLLTPSGALYSFGNNKHGQLGRETDFDYDPVPLLVKHLRKQPITYVSVGQNHVAALSIDGGVFTWGFGRYGQLGHNNYDNRTTPSKVPDLMGSYVAQVECGTNHTLAYVISTGIVYAFGCNEKGQLGIGEAFDKTANPTPIKGPWTIPNPNYGNPYNRQMSLDGVGEHAVLRIVAGGNQSMMLGVELTQVATFDVINLREWYWWEPTNISIVNVKEISQTHHDSLISDNMLKETVNRISLISSYLFTSLPCMAASFLDITISSHINISYHGFNMDVANEVLTKYFQSLPNNERTEIVKNIRDKVLYYITANFNYPNLECLRFFLFMSVSSLFDYPICSDILSASFAKAFCHIPSTPMSVIENWIGNLKPRYFKKFCLIGMNLLNRRIENMESRKCVQNINDLIDLKYTLEYLKIMHKINEKDIRIIHYNTFYIPKILNTFDLERAYEIWLTAPILKKEFSIFNYPFLFDGITKATMMKIEARCMMRDVPRYFTIFGIPVGVDMSHNSSSYHITIRRDNILSDTISQLQQATQANLKKPFRVNFYGEDALDEGGVVKEMFLLIVPEILNPDYGLFEMDAESNFCWFNKQIFEDTYPLFNAIGRLFGLAIYNNVMINLHFPLVMFKKLLNEKPNLDDLIELRPTVGKSLQAMIDYDLPDFGDTFLMNFTMTIESYGELREIELKPNGLNLPVTKENRHEYVELYVDYVLNKNVEEPFRQFKEGFMFTMQGECVKFFKPIELQEVMVGCENFNWCELRKSASYLGEYWDKHPVIEWFWNVFLNFTVDEKKMFLRFLTGCDRVPIQGMSDIKIKIQPVNTGDQHLPAAHTCFNLLDLPKYSSENILKEKLRKAIENNEGFALV